jgi:hypothetical protein
MSINFFDMGYMFVTSSLHAFGILPRERDG